MFDLLEWLNRSYAAFIPGGKDNVPVGQGANSKEQYFYTLERAPRRLGETPTGGHPGGGGEGGLRLLGGLGRIMVYTIDPTYAESLSGHSLHSSDPEGAVKWEGSISSHHSSAGD